MTDSDKTKQKLVNSIRKSKASADEDKQVSQDSAVSRKAEVEPDSRKAMVEHDSRQVQVSLRSGPRVWPD